jgi:tripartite ATP-independent transporter DctM subunit
MVNLGLVVILLFLVLILLRVPIFVALGLPPVLYLLWTDQQLVIIAQKMARTLDSFVLIAVPLFIYTGALMNESAISDKIFEFANSIVGQTEGGLAHVNIVSSLVFSGMSGSAIADIGGIGQILIDEMNETGYTNGYSAALTSSAATIGPLFPPSIPLIVFGVLSGTSVLQLLLGGVAPALSLFVGLIVVTVILAKLRGFPASEDHFSGRTVVRSFVTTSPAIGAPVVLIGGMLSGLFGVTEIAAITVVYIILINLLFYERTNVGYIWKASVKAIRLTSVVLIMVAAAGLFAHVITIEGTHRAFASALFGLTTNKILLLLFVNFLLIVFGLFMEPLSAMLITIPLVVPTLTQVGVDPVHIGVIMVFNLMIGLLTPPFGISLFMANDIADADIGDTIRELVPYYIVLIVLLLVITFVPELSLWIPERAL